MENGEIVKGQGTRVAEVSSTDYGAKAKVTATVSGLPKNCSNTASASVEVDRKPEWHMLDEWGDVRNSDQRYRLNKFFFELTSNEGQMGLIIIGTPRPNQPGVEKRRLKMIVEQAKFTKFDKTRLVYFIESGSSSAFRVYRFSPQIQEMFPYPDCIPIPLTSAKIK